MSILLDDEQKFRVLFEQAAVGVGLLDSFSGRFLHVNRKYTEMMGLSEPEMLSLDFMRVTHPDDLEADLRLMEQLRRGEIREFSLEKRLLCKDGSWIWVALTVSPMWATGEAPSQHVAVVMDITAHKEAERRLRQAKEAFDSTMDAVPDLLFDIDDEGRIHDFRAPDPELLAARPSEFLGQKMCLFVSPEAAATIDQGIRETLASGRSAGHRYSVQLASGERWFEMSLARKAVDAGRPRMIAIARDITERVQAEAQRHLLEDQLRQAQKMESLGTLAGGIAHDFNNLLAAIGMSSSLALRLLPADHRAAESVRAIETAVRRAEKLIQQILAFSRKQPKSRSIVSLNSAVSEASGLLRALLPAGIDLSVSLADDALSTSADPTQLQQVLVNLGTNAWQAIQGGIGSVRFEVSRQLIPPGHASLAPGSYARVRVSDSGVGMTPEVQARIFEPFFTTKGPGKGSGLGLSVVHGIIQQHGGAILVESTPGRGSTFDVYLAAEQASLESAPQHLPAPAGDGAKIFYVDDETLLLQPTLALLELLGYRPTGFSSARKALEQILADPSSVDLLLTDLNMPDLSGLELARKVSSVRPSLPILLLSGYSPQLDEHLAAAGIRERLTKPLSVDELGAALRRHLPPPQLDSPSLLLPAPA